MRGYICVLAIGRRTHTTPRPSKSEIGGQELTQNLPEEQQKMIASAQSSSGYMVDFIERCKAADGQWKMSNERP